MFLLNKLKDKKGNAFMNGFLIVLASMGIGTIFITYEDFKGQETLNNQLNINNTNNVQTFVTVEETSEALNNNFVYKTNISLGDMGYAFIQEETISKEVCIYSGMIIYNNGESYGVRITLENGEKISFGIENSKEIPLVFMDYLKEATYKMYNYRYN